MGVVPVKRRGGFRRDEDRRLRLSRRCGATVAVVMVFLRLFSHTSPAAHAFNVCADISRCSECVFDQTDGLMPPPLMCGWCESTQTCKEVNSTVLSYYRTTPATGGAGGAGDAEVEHTPDEIAAFREQFCADFRERNFNAVCPDMFCTASKTTNNIYICRAPSIAALVLGCILFVLSILLYTWMQTIHQLPWKYEPFLSDLLAGRPRPPDPAGDDGDTEAIVDDCRDTAAVPDINPPPAVQRGDSAASPFRDRDGGTEDFGERGGDDAATGYCPICRCRHPVPLGPGDVCFWCNVARFAFVPVSLALLSSSIVIVLSFAVSLKPWFADIYFTEVLVAAYLSFGGFVWYVVPAGPASVIGSASEVERESMPSPLHSQSVRLQLLNDARHNMASTTYLRLALRLRGRSLLDQIPELKKYRAQIASMHLAPATLTKVGGVLAAMCTPTAATMAGSGAYGGDAGTTAPTTATAAATRAVAAAGASMTAVTRADVDATAATLTASMPSCLSLPFQQTRLPQHPTPLPSAVAAAAVESTDTASVVAASTLPSDAQTSPAAAAGSASAALLSSDFLSPPYRKALKATLFRDELIMWYSEPRLRSVLMENKWLLLDLLAGLLFGIWMLMLSSVSDNTFAIVRLSGSTAVAACGLVVVLGFALLLVVVVRSCRRLYVLTDERLITVYESIIEPVVTATDLSSVRFAALYGYHSIWAREPVLDFSWEVPATERKMPAIKSHKFSGITDLHEFLYYFRMVAPQMPFHLQQISESTRQDRTEWRMHVILCIGLFVALPIITVYPHAVPDFLAAYLYVVALLLIGSTLLRGLRAQQMTCAPLNIAASWAPVPARNEMDGAEPLQPLPPSVVTHAPDGCSAPKTTPSSFGGHEGAAGVLHSVSVTDIRADMEPERQKRPRLCVTGHRWQ
ncbi:putative integral membrane protein [Leishmania donovani]|uniref:Putative integral membrane protein n=1 Tax=Leishmania donovani TaxID=5661 RepID=A0A504X1Y8_LEIDO|nr:putative integral membrane protein [Leishmania donovani]